MSDALREATDKANRMTWLARRLAVGLLEIAAAAMPDSVFQTDIRCEIARGVLIGLDDASELLTKAEVREALRAEYEDYFGSYPNIVRVAEALGIDLEADDG